MIHELPTLRYKPTSCGFHYEFACCIDGCDSTIKQNWNGSALVESDHPGPGWRNFGGCNWVCPKHKISIIVDGVVCENAFGYEFEPLGISVKRLLGV